MDRRTLLDEIVLRLRECNDDEMEVVYQVVCGLTAGRKVYGPLDLKNDSRNLTREAIQELRDYLVYTAAAVMKATRSLED